MRRTAAADAVFVSCLIGRVGGTVGVNFRDGGFSSFLILSSAGANLLPPALGRFAYGSPSSPPPSLSATVPPLLVSVRSAPPLGAAASAASGAAAAAAAPAAAPAAAAPFFTFRFRFSPAPPAASFPETEGDEAEAAPPPRPWPPAPLPPAPPPLPSRPPVLVTVADVAASLI